MPVTVRAGAELHFPLERAPGQARAYSDPSDAFELHWKGDRLVLRANRTAQLQSIDLAAQ
jgi:hypothetical protein